MAPLNRPLQDRPDNGLVFLAKLIIAALILSAMWVVTVLWPVAHAESAASLRNVPNDLSIQSLDNPHAQLYLIKVPPSARYEIIPVVSRYTEPLPDLVDKVRPVAVAGINAGFFDPRNRQTTSYVVAQEHILVTPMNNRGFVENPQMFDYLPKMLNRSEFRVLTCKDQNGYVYDVARHRDEPPRKCTILHSIQAGPDLFDADAQIDEAFVDYKNGQKVRDPIGVDRPNARSAIGVDAHGNVLLVMAAMKSEDEGATNGLTLSELASVMRRQGAVKALALDGGSSSAIWFNGETYAGKQANSKPLLRPIKSAFVVIRKDIANASDR
ncbi:MAG: phosphodiester glycosidase family protein [Cyanobacteria bacterium HKST-UBA04]|nr:phosphodiester glycosidase family protein [Cyanobacteria bacterium HKST-UBA04]